MCYTNEFFIIKKKDECLDLLNKIGHSELIRMLYNPRDLNNDMFFELYRKVEPKDEIIQYMYDSLLWIDTYVMVDTVNFSHPKKGIDSSGITIFDSDGVGKLLKIISAWKQVFAEAPERFQLWNGEYDNIFLEKSKTMTEIEDLEKLIFQYMELEKSKSEIYFMHIGN